jgi:hypothetical protein
MKSGDWLPNGAQVLLERSGVILAVNDSIEPYITWQWDGKDPASTVWGHYFKSIARAALDFESRAAIQEKRRAQG